MQTGEQLHIRGLVQGVGFRPRVWQLATQHDLLGEVRNTSAGVIIRVWGTAAGINAFIEQLQHAPPPLARIDSIERRRLNTAPPSPPFRIGNSLVGETDTGIAADSATCTACLSEILDPQDRRFRYPFTHCTHCGPRLSIIRRMPYDRGHTSMARFSQCPACQIEYDDPADRRFHAQTNACPRCGPQLWLQDHRGEIIDLPGAEDAIDAARALIEQGRIVAVKGLGGIHLACDAGNHRAVASLRQRKQRPHKALALMARDAAMVRCYAHLSHTEQKLLESLAAPIVVLDAIPGTLPESLAPGQHTLGFMLPYTPLHHLLLQGLTRPIVLTSGNPSHEPQCIDNHDALARLGGIADFWLLHDRDIVTRLDDSVTRVVHDQPQMLRRARGYAPTSLPLPEGFEKVPAILAMGAELKNSFCLLKEGQAILSQHMGDLEEAHTLREYRHQLDHYQKLFDFSPQGIAVDRHPDYLSTQIGQCLAAATVQPLIDVSHHYAHVASCMAEHGLPLNSPPVLGIALDGLGLGPAGQLWGGEFLLTDYRRCIHLAGFIPIALPGGKQAIQQPWRNTYAQFAHQLGWPTVQRDYAELDIVRFLANKPLKMLDTMILRGLNSPTASSCGRLFDAVAAALGLCRESISYEGQAAIQLESLATEAFTHEAFNAYPHERIITANGLQLRWGPLWRQLLNDLKQGVARTRIAARFHHGMIQAIGTLACKLGHDHSVHVIALGGGVFQNRLLLEGLSRYCSDAGFRVIYPQHLPTNDGGLALGQAVVAAVRLRGD